MARIVEQTELSSQSNQDLGALFGMSDRRKTAERDSYRNALVGAGIDRARLQRWPIDEWEAGKDLALILERGGQKGVQFLNSEIGSTQQITRNYAEALVSQFDIYLNNNNIDPSTISPVNLPEIDTKSGFQNTIENIPGFLSDVLNTADQFKDIFGGDSGGNGQPNNNYPQQPQQSGYDVPWTKLAIFAGGTVIIAVGISKFSN